jgi:hypothetical protein
MPRTIPSRLFQILALFLVVAGAVMAETWPPGNVLPLEDGGGLVDRLVGVWRYGIDRNPDWCVRIQRDGERVTADFIIRDGPGGAEFHYATARGFAVSFVELRLWGEYLVDHQHSRRGQRFRLRWLVFDSGEKIQELAYSGPNLITSYLVRE